MTFYDYRHINTWKIEMLFCLQYVDNNTAKANQQTKNDNHHDDHDQKAVQVPS